MDPWLRNNDGFKVKNEKKSIKRLILRFQLLKEEDGSPSGFEIIQSFADDKYFLCNGIDQVSLFTLRALFRTPLFNDRFLVF